jgi:cephalosporin-C deacetylase-like acetyl esterase|tara:strand:+ start:516 stop:1400 length:885 start_codon:yes stop_codon:yes gene_type:complete
MNHKHIFLLIIVGVLTSCGTKKSLPVSKYYQYDKEMQLQDTISFESETDTHKLYNVTYRSVNYKKVTGLLSVPKNTDKPTPVIILLHGAGDRKTVDYIAYGNQFFTKKGYAVFRIDISKHGDRIEDKYKLSFSGKTRYWSREIITQTVFDLRRAVDFIETRNELDASKIGFLGISLGGITGTVFCGVEKRVKVPVIVLAGGQLNLRYGKKALGSDAKDYTSIIEPKNFVKQIAPRPLLMINAENDEIIPPIMSKLLYQEAKKPKNIIWYPAKHHTIPIDKVYQEGFNWFDKYLN